VAEMIFPYWSRERKAATLIRANPAFVERKVKTAQM
jgi:hypothetical protein